MGGARKAETTALHNFEQLKQSFEDEIKYANQDMKDAKNNRAAAEEAKATAEGDLATTTADLADDEAALEKLHHKCMTAAQTYEAESKSRAEELDAFNKTQC